MGYYMCEVKNSANEITKVLGRCNKGEDFKTLRNWWATTPNGICFSVYDYCAYRNIKASEVYEYHIGTTSEAKSEAVVEYLKSMGLNAYKRI